MGLNLKKGEELNLYIESLAFGGSGVARVNGCVVFVEGAVPGQKVTAKIVRKRKGYAEAKSLNVLNKSPEEVEPKCPHFGECGGCRLQNLEYSAQLKYKQQQVFESLEHIGGLNSITVENTLSSPDPFYYRNKMEYSFGRRRWLSKNEIENNAIVKPKNFALGLHAQGRFDKILDVDNCYLQSSQSVEILDFVRKFVLNKKSLPYSTSDHSGFWRHLVIREGKNTGEIMINLVTADTPEYFGEIEVLSRKLLEKMNNITTIVHNINRKKAQVATGDEERILAGDGTITEKIGDYLFQISANSFFQTNTKGAKILYDKVVKFAEFKGDEIVYDLYSGAGTISIYISKKVQQVIGFELGQKAVHDAEQNCRLNGIQNCVFVEGDSKDTLANKPREIEKWNHPDIIIIDPPRAGMHAKVLGQVQKLHPQKIVYVSCNPTTFARDAKILSEEKYSLDTVQPVDMFPHTAHIELVSLFTRVD